MTEVVGLFENRMDAERAVADLYAMGYDETNVGYMDRSVDEDALEATRDPDADDVATGTAGEEAAKGAGGGAIGGAAVGAGAGLLASAGMLLVPGIGPFLAAGTLATTLGATAAGAAGGAVVGGAAGAIFGAAEGDEGYADDDTSMTYREGVTTGGSLVSVNVMNGQDSAAADAMRAAGATKVDVYGESGWVM